MLKINKIAAHIACTISLVAAQQSNAQTQNYGEALQKSLYFYEAQQAGPLPEWNRVPWRGDSTPTDGDDVGIDLRGGWFDAGDHVKFGFPMAATTTLLAWGAVDYRQAYQDSGQLDHLLNNLRFVNDYFINAHPSPNVLYGQVGVGSADHTFWGPAEVVHHKIPESRQSMKIDLSCPGPDLAAETAAAMASSSMVFQTTDAAYASTLLTHAEQLFAFAEQTTGTDGTDNAYSNCITDAKAFYNSTYGVYWDEMAWSALWLWRATGNNDYLTKAIGYYDQMGSETQSNTPVYTWSLGWNDKAYGVYVMMAALVGDQRYHDDAQRYLDHWSIGNGNRTPGGVVVVDSSGWGVNRYAANIAYLSLYYADALGSSDPLYNRYQDFGLSQIDYILGDNPANRSYQVGYGNNFPTNVHHRGSHGSWADSLQVPTQQRHILYGAVVGGPDADTNYTEDRGDYIMNEVAVDYNSGFTSAVAALYNDYGGNPLPESQFPPAEPPLDDEYLVGATINSAGDRHVEIRAVIQNRSTTPAQGRDDLYFRYFYDLSEVYAAGYSASDVTISTAYSQASSVTGPHPWGNPADHIYYTEVSFNGDVIYPGGQSAHRREVQFRASLPTNVPANVWDNSNDPSWMAAYSNPSNQYGYPSETIPVYGDDGLLQGEEPSGGCGGSSGVNCLPTANDLTVTTAFETAVSIQLEGSDSDGSVTQYNVTGAPSNGTLSGTGATLTYTPDTGFSGSDSLTYTVSDDAGAVSDPAMVDIQVEAELVPSVAISSPANGTEVELGADFTVQFNLANADGVRVRINSMLISDVTSGNSVVLTAPNSVGDFSVSLTALDNTGAEVGTPDVITLSAVSEPVNTAPVACLTPANITVNVGQTVNLDASCSADPDGDTLSFNWDLGNGQNATGQTTSASYASAGSYTVTLTASDGSDTDSATSNVTVEAATGSGQCEYIISNEWNSGYTGLIRITNNGSSAINGWNVNWAYSDGSSLVNTWNANVTGSNPHSASNLSWNGSIAPGQSTEFGFQVNKGSANALVPTVSGSVCDN
nr:glycoside hydrolase family 9 protein [Gilvimarinus polysaccharolyticus]